MTDKHRTVHALLREPPVCLFSVVENLAIFLGTRTRAKSSIILICTVSDFIEWKRSDGFVSHCVADSFCFCAFANAEWLTPDEREPPAFSSPAVESIGGILREGDCYM